MFQIGQKVRGKKWLNMPEKLRISYGTSFSFLGKIGEVVDYHKKINGINTYMVLIENDNLSSFIFEPELEPLIRVGEQLLFWEL